MPASGESASDGQAIGFDADGLRLAGMLHMPPRPPWAVIIGCHGLMADKRSPKQIALARRCTAAGLAYFRFDHRGCGESQGDFDTDTTLANRRCDLLAAVREMGARLGGSLPVGLFGSSLGGAVCLAAADHVAPFAMVTLATPVHSHSIQLPEGAPVSLRAELQRGRLAFDVSAPIQAIDHILVIHGSCDQTVPIDNARTIFQMAGQPKQELILPGGDHRISRPSQQRRFIDAAVAWFMRCRGRRQRYAGDP
jgi:alpha-beta hydrolase superfamily lysophospholipase